MSEERGSFIDGFIGYELDDYNAIERLIKSCIDRMWTVLPVKVVAVYDNYFVDVIPLIKKTAADGKPVDAVIQYHFPYIRLQGGVNGIIINPHVDDIGLCMYAQRDISVMNNLRQDMQDEGQIKEPLQEGSFRTYNPSDGIYLGGLVNPMPSRYLRICDDDIYIEGFAKPVTIHTANKVTIDATNDITLKTTTKVLLDAPLVEVTGVIHQLGTKGSGNNVFTSNLNADGISMSGHVHGGVMSGGANTTSPVR